MSNVQHAEKIERIRKLLDEIENSLNPEDYIHRKGLSVVHKIREELEMEEQSER